MKRFINLLFIGLLCLSFNSIYAINLNLMKSNIQNAQQEDNNNSKENSTNKQNMSAENLFNQYKEQS